MTDNEIIKALETCNSPYSDYKCVSCPLYDTESNCKTALTVVALDLINRQKAEIERLKKQNSISQRLLSEAWCSIEEKDKLCKTVKTEAIRAFAEKLKCKLADHDFECSDKRFKDVGNWLIHEVTPDMINNLVKEMTEVQKNG